MLAGLLIFVVLGLPAIVGLSATSIVSTSFLPLINNSGIMPTIDLCNPGPYPLPTAVGCPIRTNTPDPYAPPPEPTLTPIPTITTDTLIFLPLVERGF